MEGFLSRHGQERRDLQSRITQKKKAASKKTRKGVNDECAQLERELKARHAQELAALASQDSHLETEQVKNDNTAKDRTLEDDILASFTDALSISHPNGSDGAASLATTTATNTSTPNQQQSSQKPNRQKARLARRAAEQEAAAAQAANEATSLPDRKKHERDRMLELFKRNGLVEKEVDANGHCLYSAVADQIRRLGRNLDPTNSPAPSSGQGKEQIHQEKVNQAGASDDYKTVRKAAAKYMQENQDDFVPFLEEPLDVYIDKVQNTGEWGGQLELMALAKTYGVNINVLQGDGRIEKIEGTSAGEKPETWLAYYRHGFGLGEHYNSLRKADDNHHHP